MDDRDVLTDALLWAVNWHPQRRMTREQALAQQLIARYVRDWPRPGELGVVADVDRDPVGAAWLRLSTADDPGFGWVADDVPELSIGVAPSWRGRGIGTRLLRALQGHAREAGVRAVSLSVEDGNAAARLYRREGFVVVRSDHGAVTMLADLTDGDDIGPGAAASPRT